MCVLFVRQKLTFHYCLQFSDTCILKDDLVFSKDHLELERSQELQGCFVLIPYHGSCLTHTTINMFL